MSTSRDPEQLRDEIEQTRQEVGDTVAALAEKTDVKAQVRNKVAGAKERVQQKRDDITPRGDGSAGGSGGQALSSVVAKVRARPLPFAVLAAAVVGFLFGRRR